MSNMENGYDQSQGYSGYDERVRKVMTGVYGWMTLALMVSAITGLFLASNVELLVTLVTTNIYWVLWIAELVIVAFLSARASRMSALTAKICFIVYAMLNGVTFGTIFLIFDMGTVTYAFMVTAVTFGVMSLYGYVTKTDLSSIGNLLIMGLFGLVLATIVNMFVGNDTSTLIITYIGIVIFIGLVGYDTQKIKQYAALEGNGVSNAAIVGALSLYLDFINIFLRILSAMNKKR